jgi:hypothetical protein
VEFFQTPDILRVKRCDFSPSNTFLKLSMLNYGITEEPTLKCIKSTGKRCPGPIFDTQLFWCCKTIMDKCFSENFGVTLYIVGCIVMKMKSKL